MTWTPTADATIRRMRTAGAHWRDIAAVLACSRSTVRERARKLGFAQMPRMASEAEPTTRAQTPLPAGADVSWGAIVAGTVLDGTQYPV